jgi:FAD/FMN-containing dehydrogenase/NAD-dependent dihydropyrimidine dehydrogenase PreA subunit
MIIGSALETRLYARESVELPRIIKERLPKIQSVFQPESLGDIQKLLSYCQRNRIPLIPRGAATSGIGCIAPLRKSVMADLTLLNRIKDFEERKRSITVEAGIRWWEVKDFLKTQSLDLFTCPTSLFSTVGGWLSTGGYGINSFRYGHISNLVEAIEIATPGKTKWVNRTDHDFMFFVGTEGQMGIITKVKLRVRESRPSRSYLVFFNNISDAVDFLVELLESFKTPPLHIACFDRYRLEHKNHFLNGKIAFPSKEGVLVVLDDPSCGEALPDLARKKAGKMADDCLASLVWNERYFPFSLKHFYPSLLGCETVLPVKNLDPYIARTRKFGQNYGLSLSTEATLISPKEAVVFTIFPSDPEKITHLFHLFLTYSLARIALRHGGKPYGIGTWNLPLAKKLFTEKEREEHKAFKKDADPMDIINPAKSFSSERPFSSLLKAAYSLSGLFTSGSPVLKPFLKTSKNNSKIPRRAASEPEACANCGACTSVCPAYLTERTELVTAKGKLFLFKQMLNGASVPRAAAEKVFLCLHCHLCEHVCQSKLSLVPVWEKLESIVEKKYGRPEEKIKAFIDKFESHPACTQLLDSIGIPVNTIPKEPRHV